MTTTTMVKLISSSFLSLYVCVHRLLLGKSSSRPPPVAELNKSKSPPTAPPPETVGGLPKLRSANSMSKSPLPPALFSSVSFYITRNHASHTHTHTHKASFYMRFGLRTRKYRNERFFRLHNIHIISDRSNAKKNFVYSFVHF